MTEGTYDVAIIGGGLAGLSLAILCAEAKYKVIIFEKEEYPFHKVCGEYISLESWNFLSNLGVNLADLELPIIKTLELTDITGAAYTFNLPLGGFGISRFKLDNYLYEIAKEKGVEVYTNMKVTEVEREEGSFRVNTASNSVRTLVVAGTFGKRSNLDIKWNRSFATKKANALSNYIGIKYHIEYNHAADKIALHNFENGYCGLSKIEDGKSCLCYLTTAKNLRDSGNSIKLMEQRVLYKNPRLNEIFNSANHLYEQPLTISQISFSKKNQVENGVLMLGDAAGMISPLCGNGMSMAMHSAKIAFKAISKFLRKHATREQMEKEYAFYWQKEFSRRLWMGRTVQTFFGGNKTTSLFIKSMHYFPGLARHIIKATHGEPF